MVDFVVDGLKFNCCEQYMMFKKAMLFNDTKSAQDILACNDPSVQQKLGRRVKNYNQEVWDENKYKIVYEGNKARFEQSLECRMILMATGSKILCEASKFDLVWGCGLAQSDSRILDEKNWTGQNLLGKVLTQVKKDLV